MHINRIILSYMIVIISPFLHCSFYIRRFNPRIKCNQTLPSYTPVNLINKVRKYVLGTVYTSESDTAIWTWYSSYKCWHSHMCPVQFIHVRGDTAISARYSALFVEKLKPTIGRLLSNDILIHHHDARPHLVTTALYTIWGFRFLILTANPIQPWPRSLLFIKCFSSLMVHDMLICVSSLEVLYMLICFISLKVLDKLTIWE